MANAPAGQGLAVDSAGNPALDPTKNVDALVKVSNEHARDLRETDQRHTDILRALDQRYFDSVTSSETRRVDGLAKERRAYERELADIRAVQVKATSDLLASQLDKVTASLTGQIATSTAALAAQMTMDRNAINERATLLERYRYETGGKATGQGATIAYVISGAAIAIALAGLFASRTTTPPPVPTMLAPPTVGTIQP